MTHKWKEYHNRRGLSSTRKKGSEPCVGLLSQGVVHQEVKLTKFLALETSRAHVQESWRATGNRDSALNGHWQNLRCSKSQHKETAVRSLEQIHLLILESPLERQEANERPLLIQKLVAAILGNFFYPNNTRVGKHPFRILPLAY